MSLSRGSRSDCPEEGAILVLPRNLRMEAMGDAYLRALAAMAGVTCNEPSRDYGIDYCLREIEERDGRFRDRSRLFDIQLRCTTLATLDESSVTYDLDAEMYNDLCEPGDDCERILVLLLMPTDETAWLSQSIDELIVRRCAFWLSLVGREQTESTSKVRIRIPVGNVFTVETIRRFMRRDRGGPNG